MQIILAVTNDISTDQRLIRTAMTLSLMSAAEVTIVGRKQGMLPVFLPGIKTKRMSLFFKRGLFFYAEYNIRLFILLLLKRADILTANDLDTLPAVYLAGKLLNKPVVYDSHEYFTEVPELIGRPRIQKIWKYIERRIVPNLKYTSTVSMAIAEAYQQNYGIKMEVIHNFPVRQSQIPPGELHANPKTIIYQGALNKGRGLESAIMAMKFVNNAKMVIIGTGDIETELRALVRKMGLTEVVKFIGRIMPEELFAFTSAADLGISLEEDMGLNYRYSLPNKVFNYIQARVPVLVSDLPEIRKIVESYGIGEINYNRDPQALARVFTEMLGNNSKRREWKTNLEKAAVELCWENEEKKLLMLYHRAITSNPFFAAKDK